jgi:hypothetical protein
MVWHFSVGTDDCSLMWVSFESTWRGEFIEPGAVEIGWFLSTLWASDIMNDFTFMNDAQYLCYGRSSGVGADSLNSAHHVLHDGDVRFAVALPAASKCMG